MLFEPPIPDRHLAAQALLLDLARKHRPGLVKGTGYVFEVVLDSCTTPHNSVVGSMKGLEVADRMVAGRLHLCIWSVQRIQMEVLDLLRPLDCAFGKTGYLLLRRAVEIP